MEPFYLKSIPSPIGPLELVCTTQAVCGLWFSGTRYLFYGLPSQPVLKDQPLHLVLMQWLAAYFSGKQPEISFSITLHGTPFQMLVWQALQSIPYATTISYGELAGKLSRQTGQPVCARAVGSAVGHNPLSIILPCHRVIGADGSLTGYGGGLARKRYLLTLERTAGSSAF